MLLAQLGPLLRDAAGVGAWQVVSQGLPATGLVEVLADLEGLQGQVVPQPTVAIVELLTGNEDIPVRCGGAALRCAAGALR